MYINAAKRTRALRNAFDRVSGRNIITFLRGRSFAKKNRSHLLIAAILLLVLRNHRLSDSFNYAFLHTLRAVLLIIYQFKVYRLTEVACISSQVYNVLIKYCNYLHQILHQLAFVFVRYILSRFFPIQFFVHFYIAISISA